jgi:hypothetical protein
MRRITYLPDYFWHLYLCWRTRRRGELCEAVSFEEIWNVSNSSGIRKGEL